MDELSPEEGAIVEVVRRFVDEAVRPVARELEHANTYPRDLVDRMKEMGVFGLAVPEPWGEASVSAPCYVLVTEELARGWMSLAGAMGGHTVVVKLLLEHGTQEQKDRYLPRLATGELRATMALTEPGGGSDLQAMRTSRAARRRRVRRQRVEDLDQQRPRGRAGRAAVQDRPLGVAGAPRDQRPAGREGTRLHGVEGPAQAGLQGRRELRAVLRRPAGARVRAPRRGGGPRIRADDARPGDRPAPGGRPGPRRRPRRPRGLPRLRPGAGDVRPAHLAAPVDRQLPGRHGHPAHRRAPAHAASRPASTTRGSGPTWRPGWPSCSRPRPR